MARDTVMPHNDSAGPQHRPTLFRIVSHILCAVGSIDENQVHGFQKGSRVKESGVLPQEFYSWKQVTWDQRAFAGFRCYLPLRSLCNTENRAHGRVLWKIQGPNLPIFGHIQCNLRRGDSFVCSEFECSPRRATRGHQRDCVRLKWRDRGWNPRKRMQLHVHASAIIQDIQGNAWNRPHIGRGILNLLGCVQCGPQNVFQGAVTAETPLDEEAEELSSLT